MLEGPPMGLPLKKHEMNSYHKPTHSWIRRWLKGWAFVGTLDFRVEPLITKHSPIFHNVWRFELLWVLKCSLTKPSTLDYLRCLFFSFLWDALLMCNQFSGRIGRHGSIVLASQEWVTTGNLALLAHVDGVPQDWLWAINRFFCFADTLFLPHPSCSCIHQAFTFLHVLNSWVPGHATHTWFASNFLGFQDLTC